MPWLVEHSLGWRTLTVLALAACGVVFAAHAQTAEPATAAAKPSEPPVDYSGLGASDPLERARAVARLGDVRLLARLAGGQSEQGGRADAAIVLAALRSVEFLSAPERALEPLVPIVQGRDPDLAPAAAQALVTIARRLVEDTRMPEELSREQLLALAKQLRAIEQNPRVRADIKLAAIEAAALLDAAGERL